MNSLRASVGTRELRRISSSQNPATVAMPRPRGVTSSSTGAGGGATGAGGAYAGTDGGTYVGADGEGTYIACGMGGGESGEGDGAWCTGGEYGDGDPCGGGDG